jgi:hypothetical protein
MWKGAFLSAVGALSILPCGTEVPDHLCPHPVIVFAACASEPQQISGMVRCQRRQSEVRVERRAAFELDGKRLLDQGLRWCAAEQDQGAGFDETKFLSEYLDTSG